MSFIAVRRARQVDRDKAGSVQGHPSRDTRFRLPSVPHFIPLICGVNRTGSAEDEQIRAVRIASIRSGRAERPEPAQRHES